MKFTSATTSLFLSTLAVIASAASNVQNDINSLSDSLFTSLSLPDSFDDAKQNELLETMSNIDVLLMGAEHADSSLVRDIGPAEEPAPPTPAVDRKDLKKKIDKKVNKLNNIFESGKIFKSTPSVSEGEQKAHKAKLLEKTLDRAVTLSQQSSFARFHAKMQSGMDSFFDKVMNNPRARSTIKGYLTGVTSNPGMDKMLSKLSAEERENMLKDIAELDSGKGLSARWRHYHTALSVITFVLIIAMLSCIGFFIPLIVLGVIGLFMLISLFFTALFDRAVTVAYEDYYGWDFVAHDQSSADVEVIKRDFIALSASA